MSAFTRSIFMLHEGHCVRSHEKYGVRGDEIHFWMDEPSSISGFAHRIYRHRLNQVIPKFLIEKYGRDLCRYIMVDHIIADNYVDVNAQILSFLEKNPADVNTVARHINRVRSTAQRRLENLMDDGLIQRENSLIGIGGYKYIYSFGSELSKSVKPLRVCQGCGLKAYTEEDLKLFSTSKISLHGRLLLCKKCRNKARRR